MTIQFRDNYPDSLIYFYDILLIAKVLYLPMDKGMSEIVRILIVSDCEIDSCGLNAALNQQAEFHVLGDGANSAHALSLISSLCPDVVLLDIGLKYRNDWDVIVKARELAPNCKILIYTNSKEEQENLSALHSGAFGILHRGMTIDLLSKAICHVHFNDEIWVDHKLVMEMWKYNVQESTNGGGNEHLQRISCEKLESLTPREQLVAELAAKGVSAKLIGEQLFISEKTVRNKLTFIYSKLGVKSQLELSVNWSDSQ